MTLSYAGLIGGAAMFALSTGVYLGAIFALKRGRPDAGSSAAAREKNMSMIRMILLADIPILSGIGYYAGQTFQ
jgi:hypothetical protein